VVPRLTAQGNAIELDSLRGPIYRVVLPGFEWQGTRSEVLRLDDEFSLVKIREGACG